MPQNRRLYKKNHVNFQKNSEVTNFTFERFFSHELMPCDFWWYFLVKRCGNKLYIYMFSSSLVTAKFTFEWFLSLMNWCHLIYSKYGSTNDDFSMKKLWRHFWMFLNSVSLSSFPLIWHRWKILRGEKFMKWTSWSNFHLGFLLLT